MTASLYLKNWRSRRSKGSYSKTNTSIEEIELENNASQISIRHLHPTTMTSENPLHGWRRVVVRATGFTTLVLLLNLILATVAVLSFDNSKGVGNIFKGDCSVVERWNTALHLVINILGTIVLAASSFTMQCLSSPTRRDVDIAHAKGVSLDIGLPSAKNLFHVRYWKGIIWMILSLSTLPLHLFWNSTIFTTIAYNQYGGVIVDENFLAIEGTQHPHYTQCLDDNANETKLQTFVYRGFMAGNYANTSRERCMAHYLYPYNISHWDPHAVNTTITPTPAPTASNHRNFIFVFNNTLNFTSTQCNYIDLDQLNVTRDLHYCYAETKGLPECMLHYSSYLIYIVATCNIMKVICMCITAKMLWNDGGSILATVGDAAASFLEFPDKTTLRRCIADNATHALSTNDSASASPTIYKRKSRANMVDTMRLQWSLSSLSCVAVMGVGTVLVILSNDMSSTMYIPNLSAPDGIGFVRMIMASNSPQLILSITYFCCNSFISAQCATKEWAMFARTKKSLRVTWPRGEQRSTYWLSLPYRYSVPFIGLMLLIHFVLSQSVFIGRSQIFDALGNDTRRGINEIISAIYFDQKYSLVTLGLGFLLTTYQFYSTYATFSNRMPCHGNSSAMISAMCHMNDPYLVGKQFTQEELREAAMKPLVWGVTRQPTEGDGTDDNMDLPGHCSFSPDTVEQPVRGKSYE